MPPIWLERTVMVAVHGMLLAEFGGAPGLRDEGLLDSALARPKNLLAYGDKPDLSALAAAYAAGILKNHPFVDGNKRVAFMAAFIFLERNGRALTASETDATAVMLDVAASRLDEGALTVWLRDNTQVIPKSKPVGRRSSRH